MKEKKHLAMPKPTFFSLKHDDRSFVIEWKNAEAAMIALAIHLEKNLNEFRGKTTPFGLGTEFPNQILTAVLRKVPGLSLDVWEVFVSPASAETAGLDDFKIRLIRAIKTLDGKEADKCHEWELYNNRYYFPQVLYGTLDLTNTGVQIIYRAVYDNKKGGYPVPN